MIIDTLENLGKYKSLHPLFPVISDYVNHHRLQDMPAGRYIIKEDELYLHIDETIGKRHEDAVLESHVEMIDLQIPLEVAETFGYTPVSELPANEYIKDKDITFYRGEKPQSMILCKKGMFVVFFPQDAHAPCISSEKNFKKAIFKVKAIK